MTTPEETVGVQSESEKQIDKVYKILKDGGKDAYSAAKDMKQLIIEQAAINTCLTSIDRIRSSPKKEKSDYFMEVDISNLRMAESRMVLLQNGIFERSKDLDGYGKQRDLIMSVTAGKPPIIDGVSEALLKFEEESRKN